MIARLLRRVMPPGRREPVHVPPPAPNVRYGIATCPVHQVSWSGALERPCWMCNPEAWQQ